MTKKITIPYFPMGLKVITPLFLAAAIYLITINHIVWAIILIVIGLIILTTNYVTEIDLEKKVYNDYLSMIWISLNKESECFYNLDRIVITKGNYAQRVNTRVQSRSMEWSDFTGTLLMDDNNSLDLLTKGSRKELLKGLHEFAVFLNVGIEDRTSIEYYWVDLGKINEK